MVQRKNRKISKSCSLRRCSRQLPFYLLTEKIRGRLRRRLHRAKPQLWIGPLIRRNPPNAPEKTATGTPPKTIMTGTTNTDPETRTETIGIEIPILSTATVVRTGKAIATITSHQGMKIERAVETVNLSANDHTTRERIGRGVGIGASGLTSH